MVEEVSENGGMSEPSEHEDQATIRRAPKLGMFLLIGGALGAVVTFILTALFPVDPMVGFGPLFGYFLLYGVPAGLVLGAVVGLSLDRRSRRGATQVSVERESVVEVGSEERPDAEVVTDEPIELEAEPVEPRPTNPENTER